MNNGLIEINKAYERISSFIRRTPLLETEIHLKNRTQKLLLKLEYLQIGGSFKSRGALNKVATTPASTLVAFSGGNHGIGVAYAARCFNKRAIIYLPSWAPALKKNIIESFGAELRILDDPMHLIYEKAIAFAQQNTATFIHPYDDLDVIYGAGTIGLELDHSLRPDRWLVGVGGGGLISGLTLALPTQKVLPVESLLCPSLHEAQLNNHPVLVTSSGIAQSGLGAPSIGQYNWDIISQKSHPVMRVSDEMIQSAQNWLWNHCRILSEPSGATALAALFDDSWQFSTDPVGVILCGANTAEMPS